MSEIMAVASGTWQRILRMRVVYFLIVCVWILIWSMTREDYATLSFGLNRELAVDFSFLLNLLAGIIVAVSVTFEIPKELREGAASTLLSKPLGRTQYLLGKLTGVVVVALWVTGLITIGFAAIHGMQFGTPPPAAIQGHLLIMIAALPMAALGVFFATFLPESLSATVTALAIWLAHSCGGLAKVPVLYGGIIPDLNLLNLRAEAVRGITADWSYLALALGWAVAFGVFIMTAASLIFKQRDLK